jgi:hypothetical protein
MEFLRTTGQSNIAPAIVGAHGEERALHVLRGLRFTSLSHLCQYKTRMTH